MSGCNGTRLYAAYNSMRDSDTEKNQSVNCNVGCTTVCGFEISRGSLGDHVKIVQSLCNNRDGAWIVTLNTEMLSYVVVDTDYNRLIRSADLYLADGMPIVWVGNIKSPKRKISNRTTGVDLVEGIMKLPDVPPFAIIGGDDPLSVLKKYPRADKQCKYVFTGLVDLSDQQIEKLVNDLTAANTSLILLALGVPKQDKLARILRAKLPGAVIIGVGGTFDILSGAGRRAPSWMQRAGLEWFYRLCAEPKRLWRRYILVYPLGVLLLVKDCLARR